jgi:AcrR family transcriptional regulator
VTLELLQEHGYERLTVEAVATAACASKATIYRRWPTKAELVLAAFAEGTRQVAIDPDTGTLRGDLLRLAKADHRSRQHPREHHPGGPRRGASETRAAHRDTGAVPRQAEIRHHRDA